MLSDLRFSVRSPGRNPGFAAVAPPTLALTFPGVGSLPIAVTLLPSYLPGRRASRVDPVVALREE